MLLSSLMASGLLASSAWACSPPSDDTGSSPFEFGPNEYPPVETIGWNINHFGLNVANLTQSIWFYTELLGMRHIFTYHASNTFKIAYLGYPAGGRNGTGYESPIELNRNKNNMQGLVEFIYIAPDATNPPRSDPEASSRRSNSFSHIGLIVPDMKEARQRMIDANVTILKDIGEEFGPFGAISNSYGFGLLPEGSEEWIMEAVNGLKATGGLEFLIIEDPDGNVIEVQPQNSD